MAAVVSLRYNPDVAAQYQRLTERDKSAMRTIGAAMRKFLHTASGVLKHHTPYQPQAACPSLWVAWGKTASWAA
ncbi:MAG: hypothetical protein WBL23_18105 [Salinisphaera sp.]|uniref:hypothetical protein n=1 Tax=Salinisphaera sp. TaxID=1914330 RepID=UPI003C7C7C06